MRFQLAAFADEAGTDIEKQIAAMKENGISYLEIRGVDGENISKITKEKAKEVRKRLDDAGIAVWSLGSPYGKIGIEDVFAPHLDAFCHGLELAEILGARCCRMFSFYMPAGKNPADYREEVMERLGGMIEKAKGSEIVLCHENEKEIYGDIASRCLEIHQTFPELRAVFDPANFIQCGQDTKEAWELLHSYVEYMHIKDAMPNGVVVPAGRGVGNLPYLLSEYKGNVLTLEPHLNAFIGLADLEREGDKSGSGSFRYGSDREAFDAAATALKNLI
ncbi:MAG: TIM barrel protein [Lachnospiraceae bacterium]|nr:TIM barrel protein [Lachnospiraceae bacterium]